MKTKVKKLLGKKIYVHRLIDAHSGNKKTFENRVAIVSLKELEFDHYPFRLYFPCIDNTYLCNGTDEIEYYTKETRPEYFL